MAVLTLAAKTRNWQKPHRICDDFIKPAQNESNIVCEVGLWNLMTVIVLPNALKRGQVYKSYFLAWILPKSRCSQIPILSKKKHKKFQHIIKWPKDIKKYIYLYFLTPGKQLAEMEMKWNASQIVLFSSSPTNKDILLQILGASGCSGGELLSTCNSLN